MVPAYQPTFTERCRLAFSIDGRPNAHTIPHYGPLWYWYTQESDDICARSQANTYRSANPGDCISFVPLHGREKSRILKEQRATQGKEAAEEYEDAYKAQAALFAKNIADMEK